MGDLVIGRRFSKWNRVSRWVMGGLFICAYTPMVIQEAMAGRYEMKFYLYLFNVVLGCVAISLNLFYGKNQMLKISNSEIYMNLENQKFVIDWTSVSEVNIGLGYIVFILNGGQKQQKLDLSYFQYLEIKDVKAKVFEICEQKNIPYKNA